MNYIKIVIMTYFTKNIFENILSYCDDRIEVNQRKLNLEVMKDITFMGIDWFDIERFTAINILEGFNYDHYIKCYNDTDYLGHYTFKGFIEMFDEFQADIEADEGTWNFDDNFSKKFQQFSKKFINNRNTTNNFIEFLENQ